MKLQELIETARNEASQGANIVDSYDAIWGDKVSQAFRGSLDDAYNAASLDMYTWCYGEALKIENKRVEMRNILSNI